MDFNPFIFREYDIRGVVTDDFPEAVVEGLGKAFGTHLGRSGGKLALLGRDCRLSSPLLSSVIARGIRSTGIGVLDAGMITTPCLYFGLHTLGVDGGIMVTGSHNPPEYNGFKVAVGRTTLHGGEIKGLAALLEADDFARGSGTSEEIDLLGPYRTHLTRAMEVDRRLKVVVDSGNGTAGLVAPSVFRQGGCEVIDLFSEPDGRFPNHHPDPTLPASLEPLIRTVRAEKADLGIGFDGDADRIGVIDEKGAIIWGDRLLILFSREILARGPATIVFEVKCSQALIEDIRAHGGRPVMSATGHSLIKRAMKQEGAPLAGEMSGHMFFADRYYGYDDAIYAAVRLIGICSRAGKPLSSLLADVPRYAATPEIRIDCGDERKFEVVEAVKRHFRRDHEVIDVDGARVIFPDGWGLVRASNTQPVLVLRFEARDEARLAAMQREVYDVLREVAGVDVKAPE